MHEFLYRSDDYKEILRWEIRENARVRGYQSRLANAAGCQKSFLSQVLNGPVHLTPDHALGVTRLWKLDDDETAYFLDLVHLARASSPGLRGHLERRCRKARQERQKIAARFEDFRQLGGDDLAEYYSSWHHAAIHVLVSVPGFRSAEAIASRLRLPVEVVRQTLRSLQRMKLVSPVAEGAAWKVVQSDLFLPKGSPLVRTYHAAWRLKAIAQLPFEDAESLHFTSLYAMRRADIQLIKERLLEVISTNRKTVADSPEEEMVCFTCDLFRPD